MFNKILFKKGLMLDKAVAKDIKRPLAEILADADATVKKVIVDVGETREFVNKVKGEMGRENKG
jgi:hypothetical protein